VGIITLPYLDKWFKNTYTKVRSIDIKAVGDLRGKNEQFTLPSSFSDLPEEHSGERWPLLLLIFPSH